MVGIAKAKSTTHIVIGVPRRQLIDSYWSDQHTCYLRDLLPNNTIYFEESINYIHYEPQGKEQSVYLDSIELLSSFLSFISSPFVTLSHRDLENLESLKPLTDYLTAKIFRRLACKYFYQYHIYRFFFKHYLKPCTAILVPAYGREAIVLSLKSLGVKVIELQHGAITSKHYGYSYIKNTVKKSGPDYLLVYGQYWIDRLQNAANTADNIKIMGSHEFHMSDKDSSMEVAKKGFTQVLFISQLRNRSIILKSYNRVREEFNANQSIKCVYRPHPRESSLGLAEHSRETIYEALAISDIIVGVYSTAMYQAIAIGKDVICLRAEGSSELDNVYLSKYIKFADSTDQLIDIIHDMINCHYIKSTCATDYIFHSFDSSLFSFYCN